MATGAFIKRLTPIAFRRRLARRRGCGGCARRGVHIRESSAARHASWRTAKFQGSLNPLSLEPDRVRSKSVCFRRKRDHHAPRRRTALDARRRCGNCRRRNCESAAGRRSMSGHLLWALAAFPFAAAIVVGLVWGESARRVVSLIMIGAASLLALTGVTMREGAEPIVSPCVSRPLSGHSARLQLVLRFELATRHGIRAGVSLAHDTRESRVRPDRIEVWREAIEPEPGTPWASAFEKIQRGVMPADRHQSTRDPPCVGRRR